jgi:hypothetical protein
VAHWRYHIWGYGLVCCSLVRARSPLLRFTMCVATAPHANMECISTHSLSHTHIHMHASTQTERCSTSELVEVTMVADDSADVDREQPSLPAEQKVIEAMALLAAEDDGAHRCRGVMQSPGHRPLLRERNSTSLSLSERVCTEDTALRRAAGQATRTSIKVVQWPFRVSSGRSQVNASRIWNVSVPLSWNCIDSSMFPSILGSCSRRGNAHQLEYAQEHAHGRAHGHADVQRYGHGNGNAER